MKEQLKKIAYFLHIMDDEGQLDLTDLAFIAILIKIMVAPTLDFPAVVTLLTVLINKMHRRQMDTNMAQDSDQVKQMASQISDLQSKIAPALEQIKGLVK